MVNKPNNKSPTILTPTNQQAKVMVHAALMRTNSTQGTYVHEHGEDTLDIAGPGLLQPFGESPPREGVQEKTHSSPTLGSCSAEKSS